MAFVANVMNFPWNPLVNHHFHHFPINCGIFDVAHHVTNPKLARRLPDPPQEFDPVFWFLGTGWYMIIYDKPCHSGHPVTRPNMYVIIFDNHPCASNGQEDFLNTLALLCLSLAAGCPIPSQPTGTEPKLTHGIVCTLGYNTCIHYTTIHTYATLQYIHMLHCNTYIRCTTLHYTTIQHNTLQ